MLVVLSPIVTDTKIVLVYNFVTSLKRILLFRGDEISTQFNDLKTQSGL